MSNTTVVVAASISDQGRVWMYLSQHAVGPGNAVCARKIAQDLHIRDNGEQTTTRELVRNLIFRGKPLAANSRGFYVATHPSQLRHYAAGLEGRAQQISRRADALTRTANAWEQTLTAPEASSS